MTEISGAAWLWLAKIAGAIAGSAISLAYMLPGSRREAALRFAVGVVCGLIFGGAAGAKIAAQLGGGWLIGTAEMMLMGSASASLCAWWALGLVHRAFEQRLLNWKSPEGKEHRDER